MMGNKQKDWLNESIRQRERNQGVGKFIGHMKVMSMSVGSPVAALAVCLTHYNSSLNEQFKEGNS